MCYISDEIHRSYYQNKFHEINQHWGIVYAFEVLHPKYSLENLNLGETYISDNWLNNNVSCILNKEQDSLRIDNIKSSANKYNQLIQSEIDKDLESATSDNLL